MAHRWYVVHVYSGFEKKVAQSIREQAAQKGLADRFEEVLVPIEEVVEIRRGAKVNAERKFFPGYVLVKMDYDDESWHLVKNTPKVTGFLGGKGKPTPISDAEADRIRRDTERDMARIQQHAAQEIESAGKLARLEVQRFAAKLAIELAESKVRSRMSPEVEAALLGNFLDDLSAGRARQQA